MNSIGIAIKPGHSQGIELAQQLRQYLLQQGYQVLYSDSLATEPHLQTQSIDQLAEQVELMIVLGGDGTLLHVARAFVDRQAPLFGINLGRLGFLTEAAASDIHATVDTILAGKMSVESRFLLHAYVQRQGQQLCQGLAVNDVVMQRNEHPRMIEFEVHANEQFVCRLRADGIVLASPAGSTAYALSAGGPIVHPALQVLSLVPICPHTLSHRPIVLPADQNIRLKLTDSPAPAALNLDGQILCSLEKGDEIHIQQAGSVRLAYLPGRNYFAVLRNKLHWTRSQDVSC